ncbi:hypothetical protein COCSUDRAFT_55952 [Coccomyxa subellipsoidea C-169]|uniref:CipC-like antibiotic response protein n=1 Tax=Coccomyxa subellipsoidea (strain C-169) TaxID=574566 RepID=I0YV37_COCSC|nr:hypothetical protein COCSUDRAFT_55952 [Coccomyxa subellipsoidea C-169]EIE22256.1 hypothetical protein COCSUDRAFT_55952 [Coccomyxa subellipsoidea C-169]|eukprot:XP_005646800.1 hypothetical protein COCSUDRAFT_55952 [Coccomyxa subellipsoidea C-169]
MDFADNYPRHAESYDAVYNQPHEAKLSHEVLGGAAAFAAMRAYEQRQASEGRPPQHQFAKEILAGIVGGEVDKLVETKGMDEMDAMRTKHHAQKEAENMFNETYGRQYPEGPTGGAPYGGPPQFGGPQYGGGGAPYGVQQYGGAPYGDQGYGGGQAVGQQYEGGYRQY